MRASFSAKLVAAGAVALMLAACESPAPKPTPTVTRSVPATTSATPAPTGTTGTAGKVTLAAIGGLKGGSNVWYIETDGAWRLGDTSEGPARATGKLSPDQLAELTRRLNEPALKQELEAPSRPGVCPDGITYALQSGPASGIIPSCGSSGPKFQDLLGFIQRVTATN